MSGSMHCAKVARRRGRSAHSICATTGSPAARRATRAIRLLPTRACSPPAKRVSGSSRGRLDGKGQAVPHWAVMLAKKEQRAREKAEKEQAKEKLRLEGGAAGDEGKGRKKDKQASGRAVPLLASDRRRKRKRKRANAPPLA